MQLFNVVIPFVVALALPAAAQAQDLIIQHADGRILPGVTECVGPLSPSDADGVNIVGSTSGALPVTWQVWSTSSQTAPALVFSQTSTTVDEVIPPSGNLLFYACAAKAPVGGQDFDLDLRSAVTGTPIPDSEIRQQHAFGSIKRGVRTCGGSMVPSGTDGVHIFGFTNGPDDLTWSVFSVDELGNEVLESQTRSTFVDETIPPVEGLEYFACVARGPAVKEDFDLSLNSTTLQ
jgi:hypothetical protein